MHHQSWKLQPLQTFPNACSPPPLGLEACCCSLYCGHSFCTLAQSPCLQITTSLWSQHPVFLWQGQPQSNVTPSPTSWSSCPLPRWGSPRESPRDSRPGCPTNTPTCPPARCLQLRAKAHQARSPAHPPKTLVSISAPRSVRLFLFRAMVVLPTFSICLSKNLIHQSFLFKEFYLNQVNWKKNIK